MHLLSVFTTGIFKRTSADTILCNFIYTKISPLVLVVSSALPAQITEAAHFIKEKKHLSQGFGGPSGSGLMPLEWTVDSEQCSRHVRMQGGVHLITKP